MEILTSFVKSTTSRPICRKRFDFQSLESRVMLAGMTVGIYAAQPDASETDPGGAGLGSFVVRRPTGSTAQPLTLQYYLRSTSTASSGDDFAPLKGTVTIPAGKRSAPIELHPDDDLIHEAAESVTLALKTTALDVVHRSATVMIEDNDSPAPAGWWSSAEHYRLPVTVKASGYARSDQPVERQIDFTQVLASMGQSGAVNPDSIRVVEVNSDGSKVLDNNVPFQFDRVSNFDASSNASGNLVFLLKGDTSGKAVRKFHVYFDTAADIPSASVTQLVSITDNVLDQGMKSVRIRTQTATYYYQKLAGAFSSIVDNGGNDWINWNPDDSPGSAGEFRGFPNMGTDSFHAGENLGMKTVVVSQGPLKATIETTSPAGDKVRWEFYPTFARMTVLEATQKYYVMYEGTPGGSVDNGDHIVRSNLKSTWIGKDFTQAGGMGAGNGEEWVYFRDPSVGTDGRYLFLAHNTADKIEDSYWLMDNNMTVFGFGRHNNPNYAPPEKLLSGRNVFTIGIADGGQDYSATRVAINGQYRAATTTLGSVRAQPA
ncbi:MAG TPA: hypothetical protein VH518_22490 [Tepidisphaeraceae bacterium]|jgi:hypothetical protein